MKKDPVDHNQRNIWKCMEKPYFQQLFEPQLKNPVLVEGLAGLGNIGMIAAKHLIEITNAKVFAELYAPYFPDYVIVKKDGTCRPPCYRFYLAKTEKKHLIILTGDSQPVMKDSLAYYDVCDEILDFAGKHGSQFIVTLGGVATSKQINEVFIAATSTKLAKSYLKKGITLYSEGKIIGATGLLLGLAKSRGWKGICLLGSTTGLGAERRVALSVYKVLADILEIEPKDETKKNKKEF
jgi:uncharacterized protein (TIGR00162 family)